MAKVISFPTSAPGERTARKEANLLRRPADAVFVGREREMAELQTSLEDAYTGRGRLVLLVGEAGIGKTRTAHELGTYARTRHAQVLPGRCRAGGRQSDWLCSAGRRTGNEAVGL